MDDVREQLLKLLPEELQPSMRQVIESQEAAIAVAVIIGLVTFILIWKALFSNSKGSEVVIAGPPNTGKTTLWFGLRDGDAHQGTVASMNVNEDVLTLKTKSRKNVRVKVVDVPGHARLKSVLEQHLKEASAVVFVVDSVEFNHQKQESAELLYEILTTPEISKRKTPILIACNKADLEDQAFSVDFIKRALEKQLDIMRKTKVALSEGKKPVASLGPLDKPFSFGLIKTAVTACSISATEGDISEVEAFVAGSA